MHIGIVSQFNVAHIQNLLRAEDRIPASKIGGRTNTPVCNLLPAYLKAGHRVSIFCAEQNVTEHMELRGEDLSVHIVPHREMSMRVRLDSFKQERKALVERIHSAAPDVVHGQWTHTGHSLAALDSGLPCVITLHDAALTWAWMNLGLHPRTVLSQGLFLMDTFAVARRAKHIIGVSPYTVEHFKKVFRYKGPSDVIPNGQVFSEMITQGRHQFDPNAPVFIDIAGWGRLKNITTLLRAFAQIRKALPAARLILFGKGLDAEGPGAVWAKRRNFDQNVEFRGYASKEELNRALAQDADVFVHLSYYEACSMAICEAVIQGLPVIVSERGGNTWMLPGSEASVFVNPASVRQSVLCSLV